MRLHRIVAVLIAALALAGAGALYRGDFRFVSTEEQAEKAVVEYASAKEGEADSMRDVLHPVILYNEVVDGIRVVAFTDSEIPNLLGYVQFRHGILGGWQPLSAHYNTGPVLESLRVKDRDAWVVFAADCPPEIARYKVQANLDNDATLMAEGDVGSPKFFHVHETDRDFFPELHLFDAQGRELDSSQYLASDDNSSGPGIGSAEVNLVYVFCAVLLGIGWLIVKYLWEGGTSASNQPSNKKETVD